MDYDELLSFYTHRGFRVIAFATKHIQNLDKKRVQTILRSDAESNLDFIGFIIFENKLKLASTAVIKELNEAGIRNIMCTGDNILTAISVARECQIIDRTAHCFVPHFHEGCFSITRAPSLTLLTYRTRSKVIGKIQKHDLNGKAWIIHYSSLTNIPC